MGASFLQELTVPITARLSRKFYDTLGDEVTNELVTWLNAVDQSYRDEFRDLFAANFGRLESDFRALEARLFAELAGLRAELRTEFHRELAGLRADVRALDARLDAQSARLDDRLDAQSARLGAQLASCEKRIMRWLIASWFTMFGLVVGLVLALHRLG